MLPGVGDNPVHVFTNTYPVMSTINNDLDAFVLGITAKTGSVSGAADSWNGGASCCWNTAVDGAAPDDNTYIDSVVQQVIDAGWPVDPKRIYFWGQSAGQHMAYRYTCDHASRVAAFFGMTTGGLRTDLDAACTPSAHVPMVHFHGTGDNWLYDNISGGVYTSGFPEYVSVETDRASPTRTSTMTQHATFNGCSGTLGSVTSSIDFDSAQAGNETDIYVYGGCPADGDVELWKGNGSVHVPTMTTAGYTAMVNWFKAHPKP